MAEGANMICDI